MESKELREYIQSQINNKVPKEEIVKALKEQGGWSEEDIINTLSFIERDVENQYSAVEKLEEKTEQPETNQTEQIQKGEVPEKAKILSKEEIVEIVDKALSGK